MPSLLDRLKQRKIGQWALAYLAAAFVVIQVMDPVAEPLGLSLTVQRSILFLLPVGLLLVLILAWYHGEQGRQRVSPTELVLIAALVGAAGLGLAVIITIPSDRALPAARTGDAITLAVLPLSNLSTDPADGLFSDGLTGAIHGELSRVDGLDVTARISTVRFKDSRQGAAEIGAELGVRYLLGGGVFSDGERVRIDVDLSDSSTGFGVWSQSFTGDMNDVLRLMEETAVAVSTALGVELTAEEAEAIHVRYTDNAEAYESYLRGWALLESFHARQDVPEERLEAARDHFQHAIDLDDEYTLAIAGLSLIEGFYVFFGIDTSDERVARTFELAERAVELDPDLAEAQAALGEAYTVSRQFSEAIDVYREALRLDPENAIIWCHLAFACNVSDPPDPILAEESALEAVRLHPTYFFSHDQLGRALVLQERHEEALGAFQQAMRLNPDYTNAYSRAASIHRDRGEYVEAIDLFERAYSIDSNPLWLVGVASTHATAGDVAQAMTRLGHALEAGYRNFGALEDNPRFDRVRAEAGFAELLDRYR